MFDSVVDRYDLVNTLLSMGLDGRWRRRAVAALPPQGAARVLDVGCGTGKLGGLVSGDNEVVGMDLSHQMLVAAGRRFGADIEFTQGSVFALPFNEAAFDAAVSGFVLRNLYDLPLAFGELARVIRPGGSVAIVDITGPRTPWLRRPFNTYFGIVAPLLGRLVGRAEAYRYLAKSLAQLPSPEVVCQMLEGAGFTRSQATGMTGGMVTLWTATREG